MVYVPTIARSVNVTYEIDFLNKKFNSIDRLLYYNKQKIIYEDIMRKKYLSHIKIIHSHTLFSSGYVAYKIYKKTNIPYIVAVRNTDVNVFFKYMAHLKRLGIEILKNASKIIFISRKYKEFVLSRYIPYYLRNNIVEKSIVIPNGIDMIFLKNKYHIKRVFPSKNIKILYVGEVTKNKNIIGAIRACILLLRLNYKITYTVMGEIKNVNFKKYLHKYHFVSYQPRGNKEEVLQMMRSADIFVMPSITETFGLVYAEAMSQGLPVIYTEGQGFDGYFKDGEVGYAVNCHDCEMIADKIIEIVSNYEAISQRCIQYADTFNWEKISLVYKSLYNKESSRQALVYI
jgi:glycosyltransferase involved in cell wall biosynthesis